MQGTEDTRARAESGALPDALQQTIRAFQDSRAVLTAIELDVFSAVGAGGTAAQVAATVRADARASEMLLNALTAMGLLVKHGDRFTNTPDAAAYLAADGRHDSRAALLHTVNLWQAWSHLTDAVRQGTTPTGIETPQRDERWTEAFIAAMHKNASERAPLVVRAVAASSPRRMLDVGGGSGAYAIAFAQAHPALDVEILDVPTVTPIAQRHITAAKLHDRVRTRDGDLRTTALGEGYDIILLSAICHMLGPDENRDLLGRCFTAAGHGGRLVIQDFILDASKTAPKAGALFALNMLVGTRAGSSYSEEEYATWLREAGFTAVEHLRLPGPTGLMVGAKP
jgi:predicted O-methyltransferase YrrM